MSVLTRQPFAQVCSAVRTWGAVLLAASLEGASLGGVESSGVGEVGAVGAGSVCPFGTETCRVCGAEVMVFVCALRLGGVPSFRARCRCKPSEAGPGNFVQSSHIWSQLPGSV